MPRPSPKVDKSVSIVSKTMQGLGTRLNVLESELWYGNENIYTEYIYTVHMKLSVSRLFFYCLSIYLFIYIFIPCCKLYALY